MSILSIYKYKIHTHANTAPIQAIYTLYRTLSSMYTPCSNPLKHLIDRGISTKVVYKGDLTDLDGLNTNITIIK